MDYIPNPEAEAIYWRIDAGEEIATDSIPRDCLEWLFENAGICNDHGTLAKVPCGSYKDTE